VPRPNLPKETRRTTQSEPAQVGDAILIPLSERAKVSYLLTAAINSVNRGRPRRVLSYLLDAAAPLAMAPGRLMLTIQPPHSLNPLLASGPGKTFLLLRGSPSWPNAKDLPVASIRVAGL